jgi:hypothetical protein
MRTGFHTPCSERTGTKQESAIKHDTEAKGTPQVLAFVPKKIRKMEESSEQYKASRCLTKDQSKLPASNNRENLASFRDMTHLIEAKTQQ